MTKLGAVEYASIASMLRAIAKQPALKIALRLPGGTIPIHGSRLADVLRRLPKGWDAAISYDAQEVPRLRLFWANGIHRGFLRLRAVGHPKGGPAFTTALDLFRLAPSLRANSIPKEAWQGIRAAFGEKKYANQCGKQAEEICLDYMWQDYTPVDLEILQ